MPVPKERRVVPRSLLREDAFRAIRDAIVKGDLAPGERLNDAELSDWLGVSRTPVREALARLEQAGLVQTKPGRYTIVGPLEARGLREAQAVTAAMHELAVREAVPHLGEADLAEMRAANVRFATALDGADVDAALQADDDFHGVAVRVSANSAVAAVLDQYTPVLRRLERLRFGSLSGRDSVAQHDRIISLCAAGDAGGAAEATRTNWLTLVPLLATLDAEVPSTA